MNQQNLTSLHAWSGSDISHVLELAHRMKDKPSEYRQALAGQTLGMIFEKKSTRTRVSFEVGIYQLGGVGLFLSGQDLQLGRGETIADTARVLSRYLDIIMARVYGHETIDELAKWATVPVINGLSDAYHPCQALTDFFSIQEVFGTDLKGRTLAYVGDGNNMAHSLLLCGAKLGVNIAIASPEGYQPDPAVVGAAQDMGTGANVLITSDPAKAVQGAHVVYTDVWTSMGQEAEQEKRKADFAGYEVNANLMAEAASDAIFMHCLPAHRGDEVSADVCDGPHSIIFDQAENRLHVQKALMAALQGNR